MIRTRLFALLAVASLCAAAPAATITLPGIPSFDTNLGTLTKATVTIDPIQVETEPYETNFSSISNHFHFFNPLAASVPGLGVFPFAPVQTSIEDSNAFSSHTHTVDPLPSVQVFMGSALAWFLDPVNGVNTILFPVQQTQAIEDHVHMVRLLPTQPTTTFEFTPAVIPEPAALGLLALACLAMRRR